MYHNVNRAEDSPELGINYFLWQLRDDEPYVSDEQIQRVLHAAMGK